MRIGTGYERGFVKRYIVPVLYPGEFMTGTKMVLVCVIVRVNVAAYLLPWRRLKGPAR